MSNNTFEALMLFTLSLILLSVLVILSILFVNSNNCREHKQYMQCIESGNEWIGGSCVYRSTFRGMKDAD